MGFRIEAGKLSSWSRFDILQREESPDTGDGRSWLQDTLKRKLVGFA